MTDQKLEQRLADAIARTAPNDLDAILSRCGRQHGSVMELKALNERQDIIDVEVTEVKPKKKWGRWLAAACAALVLLGAGGGGLAYHQNCAVASVVSLDVNPSIELRVNQKEKVISCTALNEEAAAVLFSMDGGADLKGTKLDVAVNAIVGALVQAGYLDDISSAILISVEDNDQARAARLQAELVASVDGVLQTQAPGTSVLSQTFTVDAGAEYLNTNAAISVGKAALVNKVLAMNGAGEEAFDQLAALSVEELNDLLKAKETRIPIGKSAASIAAESYAGTLELSSVTTEVDPELDEVPAHYEVKLKYGGQKYEYKVDAFTGQILSGQQIVPVSVRLDSDQTPAAPENNTQTQTPAAPENNTQTQTPAAPAEQTPSTPAPSTPAPRTPAPSPPAPSTPAPSTPAPSTQTPSTPTTQTPSTSSQTSRTYIGETAARDAALKHAGCSLSDTKYCNSWLEYDDGRPECYKVEFEVDASEYEYEIGLYDGAVLKHECETHDNHHSDSHHSGTSNTTAVAASDIGQDAAKKAALDHAGVSESQTSKMKVKQDWDDGRLEYEVEFKANGMEYEYTIDGATGAVLEYESERD